MISLSYAKKIGDKYVMSFYADTEADLSSFDATKEFMFYGVPAKGSIITVTTGIDGTNYYLNDSGTFVKIEDGGDTPVPGELVPFSVGQSITGFDFGNVQNGDSSDAMDSFLAGLSYEQGQCPLVGSADDVILACADLSVLTQGAIQGYLLQETSGDILYSTVAADIGEEVPKGYQNLTGGKYSLESAVEVATVSNVQGWNGTLIGAVEGQQSLTPFAENDVVTGIRFDTSLSVAQVKNIVSSLDFTGAETQDGAEFIYLLSGTNTDGGTVSAYNLLLAARINLGGEGYTYLIHVIKQGAMESTPVWSSDAIAQMGVSEGFQNLTDGVFDFGYTGGVTIGAGDILQGSVWNTGTLCGEVTE